VLLGGPDTTALPGAWVTLHRVVRGEGGPVDSTRTDAQGRYRFRLATVDTAAAYVVSAWFDSLAYFSLPVAVRGTRTARVEDLVVYRTTKRGPPIRLARRLLTIARPAPDGTREVLEILELENTGLTTRITDDTLVPTWAGAIPEAALHFRGGEGDISPGAMVLRGDSVRVLGPIPPGRGKQVTYSYVLPARSGALAVPIDQPTLELNLLLEDTLAVASAPGMESIGVQEIEQRHFAAYRAGPLDAGSVVTIGLPNTGFHPQAALPYVIGGLAIAMVGALVWALKRKPSAISRQPSADRSS
jgi:hypothetical protein